MKPRIGGGFGAKQSAVCEVYPAFVTMKTGRAAKIIDMMERRGIVSAPEGQKPRAVLITREQYLEMQMNRSGESKPMEETMF